jgi:hypothetical protein
LAMRFAEALSQTNLESLDIKSWEEYSVNKE